MCNNVGRVLVGLFVLLSLDVFSQQPVYFSIKDSVLPVVEFPGLDNDSLTLAFDKQPKDAPYVYACNITASISPSDTGKWYAVKDGVETWFCAVRSAGAYSLGLTMTNCVLPKGSRLFIINTKEEKTYGPYTSKNINPDSSLYLEPITGDELLLEYDVPASVANEHGGFVVSNVAHDFRDFYRVISGTRGTAGSCEVDVACSEGNDWQNEKRAVLRYSFNGTLCSGVLVNNTRGDGVPYFLTANHCISDSKTAAAAIFYFNYEREDCGGSTILTTSQTLKGSTLVATSKMPTYTSSSANYDKTKLDFTLLKLTSDIPSEYEPYFAGWSTSDENTSNSVCIHHPQGDVKKISKDYDKIIDSSFEEDGYKKNCHWKIRKWDVGTTEKGSSGAPLFNDNHQIIGSLSGGEADCANPVNDFFSKFYISWDYYSDSTHQLKYWLDPLNEGAGECSGFEPPQPNNNPYTNIGTDDWVISYNFGTNADGSLLGINNIGITSCAEKFIGNRDTFLYAIRLPLAVVSPVATLSSVSLKIWPHGMNQNYCDSFIVYALSPDSVKGNYLMMRFKNHIKVSSSFHVGLDWSGMSKGDSVNFFLARNRSDKSNTLSLRYRGAWIPASTIGLYSSLGVEVYLNNHIDSLVSTDSLPERISVSSPYVESLFTNELFLEDSVSNFNEEGNLRVHEMADNDGYWSGTNVNSFSTFAEKVRVNDCKYLKSIKIAPSTTLFEKSSSENIKLCIWNGDSKPDSLLYSREIAVSDLYKDYYNIFKLTQKIRVDSICFVGVEISELGSRDTFGLYMGSMKDRGNTEHSYFLTSNSWMNYDYYDIADGLAITVGSCYAQTFFERDSLDSRYKLANTILSPDIVEKGFTLYPNPTSRNAFVSVQLGSYFTTDVKVDVYDMYGRLLLAPTPIFDGVNVLKFSVKDLSSGVYFAKIYIGGKEFSPLAFIVNN